MSSNALYDSNSVMYVLGALLKEPHLIHENKYILTEADFLGIHKTIFIAIYNLSAEGFSTIQPQEVDVYLKQYSLKYESYKKESGFEYLMKVSELVNLKLEVAQFDYYYSRVKKFTVLRDFNKNGFDTRGIYDPDIDILKAEAQNERFNEMELSEIFNLIRVKIANVEEKKYK